MEVGGGGGGGRDSFAERVWNTILGSVLFSAVETFFGGLC